MNIQIYFNRFALLVGILIIGTVCFAQKKNIIGINVTGEKLSGTDLIVGIGGTFERQVSKHHGFETGLYYRPFLIRDFVYVNGQLFGDPATSKAFFSVPILYKFYSSVINFSLGPTIDYYPGRKEFKITQPLPATFPRVKATVHVGLLAKISKSIPLSEKIFLEPEIRFNRVFYENRSYYGGGIAFKYSL